MGACYVSQALQSCEQMSVKQQHIIYPQYKPLGCTLSQDFGGQLTKAQADLMAGQEALAKAQAELAARESALSQAQARRLLCPALSGWPCCNRLQQRVTKMVATHSCKCSSITGLAAQARRPLWASVTKAHVTALVSGLRAARLTWGRHACSNTEQGTEGTAMHSWHASNV